jgi:hypothetical protein
MNQGIEKHSGNATATTGFGVNSQMAVKETASTFMAAQAKAEVEARYIMAINNRRNMDQVRVELLKDCQTPGFAENAWYQMPWAKSIQGFSIRFAESVVRAMGNLECPSSVIWEDDEKRMIRVNVSDLEKNAHFPTTIVVEKTIERSKVPDGETALSVRKNSNGDVTYKLKASEDDITKKQNSAISKAIRNGVMRLLPSDIQAACKKEIIKIRKGAIASDPDGEKIKMIEAMSRVGVEPVEIEAYLGHKIATISPSETGEMRQIYTAIRDGATSWQDVRDSKKLKNKPSEEPKAEVVEPGSEMDQIADELAGDMMERGR